MVVAGALVLLRYDLRLLGILLAALGAYLALRLLSFRALSVETELQLRKRIVERSHFLDSVQSAQTVKLFDGATRRFESWQDLHVEALNAGVPLARRRTNHEGARDAVLGLENVLSLYVGASLVLAGELTIGMLFAFAMYKRLVSSAAIGFVETWFKARLLRLHLDRIAEVFRSDCEAALLPSSIEAPRFSGLEVRGVSFAYSPLEPLLLDGVALQIRRGERMVITGRSGCGKSSLLKLVLGLLSPTQGSIQFSGVVLDARSRSLLLAQTGVVMQNDRLFRGTVAENISFFEPVPDLDRMREAARLALVADELEALPMGYDTLLGDLGSLLSAGQLQRLMIARALYRKPRLLVMDEGTANLDQTTEAGILANLRAMGITTLHAAHRPQVVADATVVLALEGGKCRVTRTGVDLCPEPVLP